jgi:glycosyltransferase involved in cell wall biosynthesis
VPLEISSRVRQLQRQGRQYDIIEIHEPLAAASCFLRPFLKGFPPIVVFSHGLEETSRLADLRYLRQKGQPISLKKRYSPLSVVLQAMYGIRHSQQVICLSTQDSQHLMQSGVPEKRVAQIHNGIEDDLLTAGASAIETEQRSGILFVGSWLVRKGILDLAPAMTQVLRRHPDLRFTVAGSGVDEKSVKRDFAPEVHDQIDVIPKFSGNAKLIELYKRHSIFVLPSYFEGQPLVMIEAAAFGMAIVTTNVCGMADFIENDTNGLLINVGDEANLIDRLEKLIADPSLINRLGGAARKTAQSYTWFAAAEQLLGAYQRAANYTTMPVGEEQTKTRTVT